MPPHSNINVLKNVDWNFADYRSSEFPVDINSLHWYPAAFVPQIPTILIQALSKPGDLVLDPFTGSGCTLIEASKNKRRFIGTDNNPYAINIVRAKLQAISLTDDNWYKAEINNIEKIKPIQNSQKYCEIAGINPEVFKWFESTTLSELLSLHKYIAKREESTCNLLRQVMFSSILNRCCSQRDHYTYITDKCFPKSMEYRPAVSLLLETLSIVHLAVVESKRQFLMTHGSEWSPLDDGFLERRDARDLKVINNSEIDLVVTSPPYLGVNDYVRSMRLTWLFFPEDQTEEAISIEVGARRKRQRKRAFEEYLNDMEMVLEEIARVLKPNAFLCLVLGRGRGKVNKDDVVQILIDKLRDRHNFHVLFKCARKIKFRRIQVPGVGTEMILVLQRRGGH